MTVAILILSICALLAVMVWWVETRASQVVSSVEDWEKKRYRVNADAVALLLDRNEEEYLRRTLHPHQFRAIQRQRIGFALLCVVRIERNAGMLMQLAQRAGSDGTLEHMQAAKALLNLAMRVRMSSVLVAWCLRVRWVLPGIGFQLSTQPLKYPELLEGMLAFLGGRPLPVNVTIQLDGPTR